MVNTTQASKKPFKKVNGLKASGVKTPTSTMMIRKLKTSGIAVRMIRVTLRMTVKMMIRMMIRRTTRTMERMTKRMTARTMARRKTRITTKRSLKSIMTIRRNQMATKTSAATLLKRKRSSSPQVNMTHACSDRLKEINHTRLTNKDNRLYTVMTVLYYKF